MAKNSTPDESPKENDDLLSDDGLDDLDIESLLEEDLNDALKVEDVGASDEIDLLADDFIDLQDDTSGALDPVGVEPETVPVSSGDVTENEGAGSEERGAAFAASDPGDPEDPASPGPVAGLPFAGKKAGKKKRLGRSKGLKKEKKKKAAKEPKTTARAPKKAKPKKEKKAKAAKPPKEKRTWEKARPAAARQRAVAFICSECYEEFLLPSNYSQEMVTCPECLHVGKKPDEDFLRTVSVHKAGQRNSLVMAVTAGILLLGLLVGTLWITSDMYVADGAPDSTIVLGLGGGAALLTIIFLWLVVRFEKNRWEVYF
jgi:hypothetical protein